ncbi:SGNH/GDSL hydrolase family protein [Neobacillus dielmonensis]|uniref:SGNH/GDSL hydrolase family protein n=1 Tax=Neobacillus dielmonensis TaxID=1347369 RepID=UPI0005AB359D|nr:SGNH/GDSL hydrolase family protein [Neobacillus dielmonensis]
MKKNEVLLFVGDSLTDCGRNEDPEGLGSGYVRIIRDYLLITNPAQAPTVMNKGISGNHVTDLVSRWDQDVISEHPNYVSILIGINDVWRRLDHPKKELVFPDQYEKILQELLLDLTAKTSAKVILMEPTIHGEEADSLGNIMLKPYVEAVHRLAKEYDAILVPVHEALLDYLSLPSAKQLTLDGVHMNSAGNLLLAKTWVESCLPQL